MSIERIPTGDELQCLVCRQPGPNLDIDHVQAKGMGGSAERDVPENKVPLCRPCHDLKHRRRIKTWVEYGAFCWQAVPSKRSPKLGENTVIRVPVRVNKRHGCLDFATEGPAAGEQSNRQSVISGVDSKTPAAGSGREAGSSAAEGQILAADEEPLGSGREVGQVVQPSAAVPGGGGALPRHEVDRTQPGPDTKVPGGGGAGAKLSSAAEAAVNTGRNSLPVEASGRQGPTSAAEPSLTLPGTITPTSLALPQNLSLEGWTQVGETLGSIHRASRFWIGDWLTFGEDTYHEKVAQSMDVTGLEFETLANIASVCRRVPPSRRRESLSFGHHTEVAAQEPERQETLLAEAEKRGWSIRALREAVSGPSEPRPDPMGLCPKCGYEEAYSRFRKGA